MRFYYKPILLIFLTLLSIVGWSQQKFTVSGYIKDAANGEALIGATLYVKALSTGATTNVYGFYSLTLPADDYDIGISYVGFATQALSLGLTENTRLDIELQAEGKQLEEVVVTATKDQEGVKSMEMSTNRLDIKTILKIPSFLGEADVIKSLQQLPGVSTVGEGASGFNVRGGSVGQNLILLDEATVYNSSHMLGFFSVFNPDAVKDTKLYKGAVPA